MEGSEGNLVGLEICDEHTKEVVEELEKIFEGRSETFFCCERSPHNNSIDFNIQTILTERS